MAFPNDIIAYNATGQLILAVEVRINRNTTPDWAAATRQLLLENNHVTNAPYFLLALPDQFYLWVDKPEAKLINPDYTVDPRPFLKPYFGNGEASEYLTKITFEMVVDAWLATLTWADKLPADVSDRGSWLIESGLFDALKQADLVTEVNL